MNILQLISSGGYYGAENMLIELSRGLRASGHQVTVGVFRDEREPHVEVHTAALAQQLPSVLFPCRSRFDMLMVLALRRFVRDHRIAVIHTHGYKSNLYALLATSFLRTHRVATVHNWILTDQRLKAYAWIDRWLLKHFHRVIGVSAAVLAQIRASGVSDEQVGLIRNGIDASRYRQVGDPLAVRESLGISAHAIVIGTVGRLSIEKGQKHLIAAFEETAEQMPQAVLMIVGGGPEEQALRSQARGSRVNDRIFFTGVRSDVSALLSSIDVFVLPSLVEAMPMAILEAMAAGKPIIATRVGEVPDIVRHGVTGFVVDPGNTPALGRAMCEVVADPSKAVALGAAGYAAVVKEFSAERMAAAYASLYHGIVGNDGGLRQ